MYAHSLQLVATPQAGTTAEWHWKTLWKKTANNLSWVLTGAAAITMADYYCVAYCNSRKHHKWTAGDGRPELLRWIKKCYRNWCGERGKNLGPLRTWERCPSLLQVFHRLPWRSITEKKFSASDPLIILLLSPIIRPFSSPISTAKAFVMISNILLQLYLFLQLEWCISSESRAHLCLVPH